MYPYSSEADDDDSRLENDVGGGCCCGDDSNVDLPPAAVDFPHQLHSCVHTSITTVGLPDLLRSEADDVRSLPSRSRSKVVPFRSRLSCCLFHYHHPVTFTSDVSTHRSPCPPHSLPLLPCYEAADGVVSGGGGLRAMWDDESMSYPETPYFPTESEIDRGVQWMQERALEDYVRGLDPASVPMMKILLPQLWKRVNSFPSPAVM